MGAGFRFPRGLHEVHERVTSADSHSTCFVDEMVRLGYQDCRLGQRSWTREGVVLQSARSDPDPGRTQECSSTTARRARSARGQTRSQHVGTGLSRVA